MAAGWPAGEAATPGPGFERSEGLSSDVVWAITRDKRGTLWAGTELGLNFWDLKAGRWRPGHCRAFQARVTGLWLWLPMEPCGLGRTGPACPALSLEAGGLRLPRSGWKKPSPNAGGSRR